jgi:isopenicillin N synthase-like dioxygenase
MKLVSKSDIEEFLAQGFLRITVPQSIRETVTAAFNAGYPFFRAAPEEKIANKLPEDGGYRPYGIEYSDSPEVLDQIESFTVSDRTRKATKTLPHKNARVLHKQMLNAFDALEHIAEFLTIHLAEAITGELYENKYRGAMRRWSRLQLNYARPANTTTPFINEAHEDGVLMTLVCATCPGFELQMASGEFVPLTTRPGELIAMAGEITWLLSGGLIQPVYHRVSPAGSYSERLSLIFLGDVYPRLCQPWVKNETNANIDIGGRVLTSAARFGLQAFKNE